MIGKTVSHYKILEKLGEGGMGVVYKAQDLKLPRFVALKFLPPHLSSDENAKRRFIHEAEAASALDHPHISTIYEIDETGDGRMFIAMAYYEGQTLKQKVAEGPVSIDEAIDIVSQITSGLAKAHHSGILHRDIKPANILFTSDGQVKIVDFGLAKLAGQTRVTRTGTTVGTVSYMSPEQARGEEVDQRSDVFSVGIVLYELLTGEPPFRGDHEAAVIYSIMNEEPTSLKEYRSDLPEGVQQVIENALAKDREERYSSAADLLGDLEKLREGRQVAALERKTRRRIRSRAILYAAVGLVIIVAGYMLSRLIPLRDSKPSDEAALISPTVVAVLPFTVRGGEEYADLGEGMVDLLSTKLDGAGALRSVGSHALLSYVKRTGGSPGPELGREIAGEFGAGLYLLGDIMGVGRRLHINASLYESDGGMEPVAEATVEGEADEVTALVDELASRLLVERLGEDREFPFEVSSVTTESYPALKAYLEGEARFRGRDLGGAIESFQRAVSEDSTFALAWYRLSVAIWWPMTNEEEARSAIDQALRYSEGLPEHERLHIRAHHAWLHGDYREAEQLYRTIVGGYPDDFLAWQKLSAVQTFYSGRKGQPMTVAREAAMRALALNPKDKGSFFRLRTIAAFERKFDELADLLRRYPEYAPIEWRTTLAFGTGDQDSLDLIMKELATLDDYSLSVCMACVISYTDDLVRAAGIVGLLTQPLKSDEVKGFGHVIMAHLEAAKGRWRAAKTEFEAAEKFNTAMAIEYHALLACLPFLPVSVSELEDIRGRLEEWKASEVPPSKSSMEFITIHDDVHQHLRIYLLGLLSVRLEDYERARRYMDELERLDGPPHVTVLAKRLVHGLRARMAWKEGNTSEALNEFHRNTVGTPTQYRLFSSFYKDSFSRFMCAELLHELGRDEEALGWTVNFPRPWSYQCVYMAPVYKRRAEHYEQTGQPAKAAENYAKFVERWKDCDEELRPAVDEVKAKLDALNAAQ